MSPELAALIRRVEQVELVAEYQLRRDQASAELVAARKAGDLAAYRRALGRFNRWFARDRRPPPAA
jgi:hypothetical protein